MKKSANGIEIDYVIEGEGPVVTMSHALGTNVSLWEEQAKALQGRYRVLRFDTRGHGRTSAPPGPYTLDQLAEDAAALLGALGIAETHFVGISMGGMIGQTLALKRPALVKSLTLVDTTSRYPASARPMWDERIRTVETEGMEALVGPMLERWFTAPFRARRRDLMDRVGDMIRRTPAQGYVGCCHALPTIDVTDRLKELHCPALVIVGEEDPGTPVAMSREIHAALPGAELAILRSASHLSSLEQPQEFDRVLTRFLDKATERSTL
jgi:3-oxoadipate enol-lactonase